MRPVDIVPPSAPSDTTQTKKGLFSRLFKKKEQPKKEDNSPDLGDLDLDAIKKKIGMYPQVQPREEPKLGVQPTKEPTSPPPTVEMNELLKETPREQKTDADHLQPPVYNINIQSANFGKSPEPTTKEAALQPKELPKQSQELKDEQSITPAESESTAQEPAVAKESTLEKVSEVPAEQESNIPDSSENDTLEGIEEPISILQVDESNEKEKQELPKPSAWEEHEDSEPREESSVESWDEHPPDQGISESSPWEKHADPEPLEESSVESAWDEQPTENVGEPSSWEEHPVKSETQTDDSHAWDEQHSAAPTDDTNSLVDEDTEKSSDISWEQDHETALTKDIEEPLLEAEDVPDHEEIAKEHLNDLHKEHKKLDTQVMKTASLKLPELPELSEHPHEKQAEEGKEFHLNNGSTLTTLRELEDAVLEMDEETFSHHVKEERNDFVNWVEYVLLESELAQTLRLATTKKQFLKAIKDHAKKADKHRRDHKKKVDTILRREKRINKALELREKMDALKEKLHQKREELEDAKNLLTEQTHKKIEDEVQKRVDEKEVEIESLRAELESKKDEFERRLTQVEQEVAVSYNDREEDLRAREQKVKAKLDSLLSMEQTVNEERKKAQDLKNEAIPLVEKAQKVKEDIQALEERQKNIEERERTHEQTKEELENKEHDLVKREEELSLSRASLNQLEQQITKQDAQLRKEQDNFKKLKAELDSDRKNFKNDEKKRFSELRLEQKKLDERLRRAEDAEKRLEQKLQERRKISEYITDAQRLLQSKKSEPKQAGIRNLQVYGLIDEAKSAIKKKNIARARELYNEVRDAFNREKLEPQEKSALYAAIRELYDEIHMASLRA